MNRSIISPMKKTEPISAFVSDSRQRANIEKALQDNLLDFVPEIVHLESNLFRFIGKYSKRPTPWVILDCNSRGRFWALYACPRLISINPMIKIVLIGGNLPGGHLRLQLVEYGVAGWLDYDFTPERFRNVLDWVYAGTRLFPPGWYELSQSEKQYPIASLTPKESQLLQDYCTGQGLEFAAESLGISLKTAQKS